MHNAINFSFVKLKKLHNYNKNILWVLFCFFSLDVFWNGQVIKPFKNEIAEHVAALMRHTALFYNTQVYYFEHPSLFSVLSTAARNRKYQHGRLCSMK